MTCMNKYFQIELSQKIFKKKCFVKLKKTTTNVTTIFKGTGMKRHKLYHTEFKIIFKYIPHMED